MVPAHIWERIPYLVVVRTITYRKRAVIKNTMSEAGYYHARAAEMMAKAQAAPTKATRVAYLNLARIWTRKADALEREEPQPDIPTQAEEIGAATVQKN